MHELLSRVPNALFYAEITKMTAVLNPSESSSAVNIRVSANEKARTITHVCNSGTLSTISSQEDSKGLPFGSFVDYILDDKVRSATKMCFSQRYAGMARPSVERSSRTHTEHHQQQSCFTLLPAAQVPDFAAVCGVVEGHDHGGGSSCERRRNAPAEDGILLDPLVCR
jgi:hypothetical protein